MDKPTYPTKNGEQRTAMVTRLVELIAARLHEYDPPRITLMSSLTQTPSDRLLNDARFAMAVKMLSADALAVLDAHVLAASLTASDKVH